MGKYDAKARQSGRKRNVLIASALGLVAVLLVGGTLAYYTASNSANTTFVLRGDNPAVADIQLSEEWSHKNGRNLMPGTTVRKVPSVTNNGDKCYLRIKLRVAGLTATDLTKVQTRGLDGLTSEELAALDPVTGERFDRIVSTIYADLAYASGSSELTPATTETQGSTTLTRADLIGSYGHIPTQSELEADTSLPSQLRGYASSYDAIDPSTEYDAAIGATLNSTRDARMGSFRNVTTKADYEEGILTFEYLGPNGDGILSAKASTGALFSTIVIPPESSSGLGDYVISVWAEGVLAADFEHDSTLTTAEERRHAAMAWLQTTYGSSKSGGKGQIFSTGSSDA